MSKAAVRAIDTLLRVKRRRLEQAEAEVKRCRQVVREREQARDEARGRADACRADERACEDRIDRMCRGGFLANELIARQLVLQGLHDLTAQADKAVTAATEQVTQAQQALAQARAAVQRAEQLVKYLQDRRETVLREIEHAQDELQDEESEEAAVARMLAAVNAEAAAVEAQGVEAMTARG